jgi:hypothetical protein
MVLDLRGLSTDNLHPTVLVADSLLDHGCIGGIETAHGETQYQADSDVLFREWPLVVLIDGVTAGTAEWLAAALQDNHRAVLVGLPSASALGMLGAGVQSTIPVGDGAWSIVLTTGRLERGDGRPLGLEAAGAPGRDRNFAVQPPDAGEAARAAQPVLARALSKDGSTLKAGTPAIRQFAVGAGSKYGLKPDHTVGASAASGNRLPRPRNHRTDRELVSESDEPLQKAVQLLRESLKKNRPASSGAEQKTW